MNLLREQELYDAVQRLNWNYGKGDVKSIQISTNGVICAVAKLQYGWSQFTVKVDGRTVYARGHQITVK